MLQKTSHFMRQANLINGEWVQADSGKTIDVINPATGLKIGTVPRSGKAVSRRAAEPYLDRLLKLPSFLVEGQGGRQPSPADILSGFALTGFFLRRHILDPRGLREPPERARLVEMATRASTDTPLGESSTA